MNYRSWAKDRATGVVTVRYHATRLGAVRAYMRHSRNPFLSECGWETREHGWEYSIGSAGVRWSPLEVAA